MTTILTIGEPGSRNHEAALRFSTIRQSGERAQVRLLDGSTAELFDHVAKDADVLGVLPFQHGVTGFQPEMLGYWLSPERTETSVLHLNALLDQRIRHHLVTRRDTHTPEELSVVISDDTSRRRCETRIANRFPLQISPSMVDAVRMVASARSSSMGALASSFAAEQHDLTVLEEDLQEGPADLMRYCVFGKTQAPPTGNEVTSVLAWTSERLIEAIVRLTSCVGQAGLNITNFQALPEPNRDMRVCYMEFSGHARRNRVTHVIKELRKVSNRLTILGSFPCLASN